MANKELLAVQSCATGTLTKKALKSYLFKQNKGLNYTIQKVRCKLDHIDKKIQLIDIMTDNTKSFSSEIKEHSKSLMNELIDAQDKTQKDYIMDKISYFIDSLKD